MTTETCYLLKKPVLVSFAGQHPCHRTTGDDGALWYRPLDAVSGIGQFSFTLFFAGGWTNPLIADWFTDYARVAYTLFGDRVKWWLTINEPLIICDLVYSAGILAPPIVSPDLGAYLCAKNVLMAHAKGWRLYDVEFRPKYHGE